ncbi:MAG: hypothetical protein VXX23_05100 [Actinomycetota bacterium]|nr:hypothetical protein [Actinomycetota bacterium]MEC8767944.1 hypothetical protein [Actinomycetota bacterium]
MRDTIEHDDPCDDCTHWIDSIPEDILLRGPAVRTTEPEDLESEAERLIRLSLR